MPQMDEYAQYEPSELRPELITLIDGWLERKGISPACPACQKEQWLNWHYTAMSLPLRDGIGHYFRSCGNCGHSQFFRDSVIHTFTYEGGLKLDAKELLDGRLGPGKGAVTLRPGEAFQRVQLADPELVTLLQTFAQAIIDSLGDKPSRPT